MAKIKLPNKSHFKTNEICGLTGVKPYVLRFWENEFDEISSMTSSNGQKLYTRSDIEVILKIKKLLFEEKLTIDEAKARIGGTNDFDHDESNMANESDLAEINPLPESEHGRVDTQKLAQIRSKLQNVIGESQSLLGQ